jgi:tetratricopeptide (TPR) repeat protein
MKATDDLQEFPDELNKSPLVQRPSSAIEKATPRAKRILSRMIADTIALATSKEVIVSDEQVESWFQTGENYYMGHGVPQDDSEAVKWFHKAAGQGHADAQLVLGNCYRHGQGVTKDRVESAKWYSKAWYRKAIEQNNADAQFSLGDCYRDGDGVPQDYAEAVKWLRKAADQGHDKAQLMLSYAYANGEGVAKDEVEAAKWLRKAADQGNAEAQFSLGERKEKIRSFKEIRASTDKTFENRAEKLYWMHSVNDLLAKDPDFFGVPLKLQPKPNKKSGSGS